MTTKENSPIQLLVHLSKTPLLRPDLTPYVGLLSYTVSFSCILDDHSLVELSLITSDEDSSYINANFIKVDGEEIKHSMFFCAPNTGMGRRLRRRCSL